MNPKILGSNPVENTKNRTNPDFIGHLPDKFRKISDNFNTTWVAFSQGRTLVGVDPYQPEFNVVNKTGGTKTVTLNVNQIPRHKHGAGFTRTGNGPHNYGEGLAFGIGNQRLYTRKDMFDNTGGGKAHPNLPPYKTIYIWQRIS